MKPHPLAKLIPASNSFQLTAMSPDRADVLERIYRDGFAGCFLEEWETASNLTRVAKWDRDEFMYDTPGKRKWFSDVVDSLGDGDGECHINTKPAFEAWQRDGQGDRHPFRIYQDYGDCVDASLVELFAQFLGVRSNDPTSREVFRYLPAFYAYAERGYCQHGWTLSAAATVYRRIGLCLAKQIEVAGNTLDWRAEDASENAVAREYCRRGLPTWLTEWTAKTFPFEDGAITRFDCDRTSLKKLFAAGGGLHTGGTRTSGSSKPFVVGRVGPHAQSFVGYDDSEQCRQFYTSLGFRYKDDDFPVVAHQTWGGGWSKEVGDPYWPSWWGPKPQGAWVWLASQLCDHLGGGSYAYLPMVKGFPSDDPQPDPDPVPDPMKVPTFVGGDLIVDATCPKCGWHFTDGPKYIVPKPRV